MRGRNTAENLGSWRLRGLIDLTGRVLEGLDEYMLRLGHMTLLIETAKSKGGSRRRLERALGAVLTATTTVPDDAFRTVCRYLEKSKNRRYSNKIECRQVGKNGGQELVSVDPASGDPEMWLQDFLIAQPEVRSHVGAVTIKSKPGSKTGISHLLDWADALNLVSRSGRLTSMAELIAGMRPSTNPTDLSTNPYHLGFEKIPLGFAYIWSDFDVFCNLVSRLAEVEREISKEAATQFYVETVESLAKVADQTRALQVRQSKPIRRLWRDLEQPARKEKKLLRSETSTAWHRASSRFETLVDLGLLTKGDADDDRKFKYNYGITDRLKQAALRIADSASAEDWFDRHFLDLFWEHGIEQGQIPTTELIQALLPVVKVLEKPTNPLPLITVSIGIIWQSIESGKPHTLGATKESLERLSVEHPEIVRLSRGARAGSSDFISINQRNLLGAA